MDNSGRIYRKNIPFTQVANSPLRSDKVSLKAKGLYAIIQSYITIPNFTLYKNFLKAQCKEGATSFDSAWKELKEVGLLIQHRISTQKGFVYEYELLDEIPPHTENQGMGNQGVENEEVGIPSLETLSPTKPYLSNKKDFTNIEENNTNSFIMNENELKGYFNFEMVLSFLEMEQFQVLNAKQKAEEIFSALTSVFIQQNEYIYIGKRKFLGDDLKNQLLKLTPIAIASVIKQLSETPSTVKNTNVYILNALYEATYSQGALYNDLKGIGNY